MDYEFHELANVFRMLDEEEYTNLANNLLKNGFNSNNPIVLYEEQILDGRNRYKACKELEIEPIYREFGEGSDPEDPSEFVHQQNYDRRQLTPTEKAMYAARRVTATQGGDRRSEDFKRPHGRLKPVTIEEAADAAEVSPRTVRRAKRVLDHGTPELIEAVDSGDLTVGEAEPIVALEPEEQIRVIRSEYTGNDEWYTPTDELDRVKEVLGTIDLDPASCEFAQEVVQAENYYIEEDDGLKQNWYGKVFLNPPFSRGKMEPFVIKLCQEYNLGDVEEAVLLTNNFTDTKWFHLAARNSDALCLTEGRINFYNENGQSKNAANGHAYFYFGSNVAKFVEVFDDRGTCFIKR